MSILNPDQQRLFVQSTVPWAATVPNSTGSATVATGDGVQFIDCSLVADSNKIKSRVRSGNLGQLAPRRGRRTSSFSLEVPLQGSGTAGTVPDMDAILVGLFGATGTVVSSTSVTYAIAAVNVGLTLWKFKDPAGSNVPNQVGVGAIVNQFEINAGEEAEATLSVSGPMVDVIEKPNFGSLTTAEKFGLTSFPSEPSATTFLGTPALAFTGSVTINSVATFKLRSFRITGNMNRNIRYAHGGYAVSVPNNSKRSIVVDFSVYEEDTSDQAALRHLSRTGGTFDASLAIGGDAGNIFTFNLNNLVIGTVTEESGGPESILNFNGCEASITNASSNDELNVVLT